MQANAHQLINQATRIAGYYTTAPEGSRLAAYLLRRYKAITAQLGFDPLA
ncbi:hypothetical protein ACIBCR_15375 [Micromonospora echinospora]